MIRRPRGRVHPPPAAAANRSDSAPTTCARGGAVRARRLASGSITGRRAIARHASTRAGRGFDRPLACQAEESIVRRWHSTWSPRPSCSPARGPTTQRHRPRRSPLLHGASGGLARLKLTRCHIWRLRTQRGRRAVMGWETRLGAPAGWPGTLGDGPGRRTRLVAHREARLRGQPGVVDVFPLISHSRPIAAVGARPQVLSSHLPKFGARARKMASFLLPWAAVAK